MLQKNEIEELQKAIQVGNVDSVLADSENMLHDGVEDDRLYYLRGKAFMKKSNWQEAVNCFLKAEAINPQSPARQARMMLNDIWEFYHKDLYNP